MKIIYLIAGLYRPAGMERALALKANRLASDGYDIMIVTTEQKGRKPAFELNPSIRTIDLGIGYEDNNGQSFADKLINYPAKIMRHRRSLEALLKKEKADVVVSMFCNEAAFLPFIKDGSKKVLEIHFSRFKRLQYGRRGLWRAADRFRSRMDRKTVSRYSRFVVLTHEDAILWGNLPNLRVIPNPRTFSLPTPSPLQGKQVLACGRYSHQKAFDRLVAAWKMIDTDGWVLRLAGDGPVSELGPASMLTSDIITGPAKNIMDEYLSSSIFALSSRYEGLPMVLLEAQAAGLPIVSFACKCGPRDIVNDGVDGILVEDGNVKDLAAALEKLMRDEDLRRTMGAAAFRNSENYDIDKIICQWETMFEELS